MSHTPGPWAFGLETDDTHAQIINAEGEHVADVSIDPLLPTARLIAAAPEMLAMLQRLTHPMADDDDLSDALALIDRVTGG